MIFFYARFLFLGREGGVATATAGETPLGAFNVSINHLNVCQYIA